MTQLHAVFQFQVRGLWVRREVLGTSHHVNRGGSRVTMSFPRHEDDLRHWGKLPNDQYLAVGGGAGTVDDPEQARSVLVVQVLVETQGDVSAADFHSNTSPSEAGKRAVALMDRAQIVAEEVISEFVALVRAEHGFHWLGLSTDQVQQVGPNELREAATGARLPVGASKLLYGTVHAVEDALSLPEIVAALDRVADGEAPPLAEVLLADAQHLATDGLQFVSKDGLRAVLMAAIACEVKAKVNIRDRAKPAQRQLIEYLLGNPREITVTAADGLFNTIIKAAQGRSLKEDDKDLFRDIRQLFEVRNRVAHRGERPSEEDVRRLVTAARRAFEWLDQPPREGVDSAALVP